MRMVSGSRSLNPGAFKFSSRRAMSSSKLLDRWTNMLILIYRSELPTSRQLGQELSLVCLNELKATAEAESRCLLSQADIDGDLCLRPKIFGDDGAHPAYYQRAAAGYHEDRPDALAILARIQVAAGCLQVLGGSATGIFITSNVLDALVDRRLG